MSKAPQHGTASHSALVLGAIGVVFGDIGTSPLYTLREAFSPHYGLIANHDTVLGILSLIFWSLMLVVTLKYVTIIMRADNNGEGGIMALMALAQRSLRKGGRSTYVVGILGVFGAALFFGDGVITPAVTVLSAIEGLEVVAPSLSDWIVPVTVLVLVALFTHYAQKEDSVSLYGFLREGERRLFRDVQKVSGIGAKIALAVLSGASVDEFARLVQTGDIAALTRIPGIGKKTAERMVVELRDRAADFMGGGASFSAGGVPADALSEAVVALQQLGYKPAEAARMARDAKADGDDAASIIRKALKSALR